MVLKTEKKKKKPEKPTLRSKFFIFLNNGWICLRLRDSSTESQNPSKSISNDNEITIPDIGEVFRWFDIRQLKKIGLSIVIEHRTEHKRTKKWFESQYFTIELIMVTLFTICYGKTLFVLFLFIRGKEGHFLQAFSSLLKFI